MCVRHDLRSWHKAQKKSCASNLLAALEDAGSSLITSYKKKRWMSCTLVLEKEQGRRISVVMSSRRAPNSDPIRDGGRRGDDAQCGRRTAPGVRRAAPSVIMRSGLAALEHATMSKSHSSRYQSHIDERLGGLCCAIHRPPRRLLPAPAGIIPSHVAPCELNRALPQ